MACPIHVTSPTPASSAPLRRVPVVRGLPLLGLLPDLLRDAPGTVVRAARSYPGEIVGLRLGPRTVYLVTNPAHVERVLHDRERSFSKNGGMAESYRLLVGNGVFTAEGEAWLKQRRLMQPLFSVAHLTHLADVMAGVIEQEVERLASFARSGETFNMVDEMMQLTQRVLFATMFGSDLPVSDAERLGKELHAAMRSWNLRILLYFLPHRVPLPGDRRFARAVAHIDAVMMNLVAERRRSGAMGKDLLSLLLSARGDGADDRMDDRQIRDELVTLFVGGSESTANLVTWTWYELDRHPDVARRVRDEIDAVLGDRRPVYADLERLVYTRQVVHEVLRLYTPAWLFARFAKKDVVVDGYPIPAGAAVVISPFTTQRDPAYWEDPETFDPGRFSPERSAGRHSYAFCAFGGGPRICIGNNFTMIESLLIIAMIARRVRPRLVPGQRIELTSWTALKPRYGMKMRVEQI